MRDIIERRAALGASVIVGIMLFSTLGHTAVYEVDASNLNPDKAAVNNLGGNFQFSDGVYSNWDFTLEQSFFGDREFNWTTDNSFIVNSPVSQEAIDGLSSLDIVNGGDGSQTFPEKLSQVVSDNQSLFLLSLEEQSIFEWTAISLVFEVPLTSSTSISLDQPGNNMVASQQGSGFGGGDFGSLDITQNYALQGTVTQVPGTVSQVPVPATLTLFGMGLVGLGLVARRRRAA